MQTQGWLPSWIIWFSLVVYLITAFKETLLLGSYGWSLFLKTFGPSPKWLEGYMLGVYCQIHGQLLLEIRHHDMGLGQLEMVWIWCVLSRINWHLNILRIFVISATSIMCFFIYFIRLEAAILMLSVHLKREMRILKFGLCHNIIFYL